MSLKALPVPPSAEETARVARAAFPQGHRFVQRPDALGTRFTDDDFADADLVPTRGQPAEAPWRLAAGGWRLALVPVPVPVLQFVEGLTDRQAADAVRGRLDGKDCAQLAADRSRLRSPRAAGVPHAARAGRR